MLDHTNNSCWAGASEKENRSFPHDTNSGTPSPHECQRCSVPFGLFALDRVATQQIYHYAFQLFHQSQLKTTHTKKNINTKTKCCGQSRPTD